MAVVTTGGAAVPEEASPSAPRQDGREPAPRGEPRRLGWRMRLRRDRTLLIMLVPALVLLLVFNYLPMFGTAGQGLEFDYITPVPANREQDNAELTAKAAAALVLVQAGYDRKAVLKTVGLPDMDVAEIAAAGAQPQQPAPDGEEAAESAGGGDDAGSSGIPGMGNLLPWAPFGLNDNRFGKVNGHSLVGAS